MKQFALIGASGYIAPRHLKAIKDTKNNLIAALDPFDSVGVMDSYFPNAAFFTQPEIMDRHMEKIKAKNIKIDYLSICSPNYLHDAHIRMGLRWGANAICEKPLVLNPWNLDALAKIESEYEKKIFTVLQLRHHDTIKNLKSKIENSSIEKKYDIDLTYITSRGNWYYTSWKGDDNKSGGIATNIGIHFFDMLVWIFGNVENNVVNIRSHDRACGFLEFEKARVRWFLSINKNLLPTHVKKAGQTTFRSIKINNDELEFSDGFKDLHTEVYREILNDSGASLSDARSSIEIVHQIRKMKQVGLKGDYHPLGKEKLSKHPFIK